MNLQNKNVGNTRVVKVGGVRNTLQRDDHTGIKCYNCKGIRHYAKGCREKHRVKDYECHKEQMLLSKKLKAEITLNAKECDFLATTCGEDEELELDTLGIFMAKIQ
uniref:CCHC-type domain-containing protein n=1 Tax=Tanacetum cinerariifolium TaxID=118510 RepID=A0A6L2JDE1_TANCI|nr:hypothetical protein [Tanacetum cinerariifolium]